MSNKIFLTVTVMATFLVVTCNSLQCYKCTAFDGNPKYCVEINSQNQAERTNCSENDSVCINVKREVNANNVVYSKIVRDCVKKTANTCGDFQQILNTNAPSLVNETITYPLCNICDKNLCNSSKNLMSYVFVTIFMLVITKTL